MALHCLSSGRQPGPLRFDADKAARTAESTGETIMSRSLSVAGSVLVCVWPVLGAAQEGAGGVTLEEVIVTTQRRATDVQTTAAAVTAFSGEDLALRSAGSIEDLNALSPSVLVSAFQGEAQIYIRGIGYSSVVGGSDSSTAFHSDGVYISRTAGAMPAYLDVERVEVLRGPQGTLYGRNATGGSVNVISKGPSDVMEYETQVTLGNYERYRVAGAIGGPVSDRVGIRFAASREARDGYTDLLRPDGSVDEVEDKDEWMARFTLEAQPSDTLTLTLKADYYEANDAAVVWHYFGEGTATNPIYQALVPTSIRSRPYARSYGSDLDHFNEARVSGVSGKLEWEIGDYTLTSLTSYRETRPYNRDDLDLAPVFGVDQLRLEDHDQVSQELQLTSAASQRVQWILGAYFFDEDNFIRNEYFLPFTDALFGLPDDPTCCSLELNGRTETRAYALFGEATVGLTDRLDIVLGGRYSDEKRGGANLVVFRDAPLTIFDNVAQFDDESFSSFTPKAGLNFELSDEVFLYTSASRGFKSGGFNPGSYQNEPFDPEEIWAYEVGAKLTMLGGRLRANTAAFLYDYTDLQVQDVENNNVVIRNAAEAEIKGIEIETSWLASPALRLDTSLTWLDAQFSAGAMLDPKFPGLGVQGLSGKQLPRAPEWKIAAGAQYEAALGGGATLTLRADYIWQDEIFFSAFNVAQLREGSYGWAKARLVYTSAQGRWSLAAFVDNATDEVVATNKIYNGDIIGSAVVGNLAPPRTYGIELRVRN
jgi:iron complex outermembrane recepter protein